MIANKICKYRAHVQYFHRIKDIFHPVTRTQPCFETLWKKSKKKPRRVNVWCGFLLFDSNRFEHFRTWSLQLQRPNNVSSRLQMNQRRRSLTHGPQQDWLYSSGSAAFSISLNANDVNSDYAFIQAWMSGTADPTGHTRTHSALSFRRKRERKEWV